MSSTPPIVTIFGGSGFVGRYIASRMARKGWRVRVAVRRPNEAMFVKTYGDVGQVEPIFANVRDDQSTSRAIAGADAVVNCVGILSETSRQKFDGIHTDAAERIARLSSELGVSKFVHISAIGANPESESNYAKSKAHGETAVLEHFPSAVIMRPSIVFGAEDEFFNRFAGLSRISPIIPVIGGNTKFQPVFVDDVAAAVEAALLQSVDTGIYELGGPDVASFRDLMVKMLGVIRRKRIILNIPFGIAAIKAGFFDLTQSLSGGLVPAPFSRDQVKQLKVDNIVSGNYPGLSDLGVKPTPMASELEDYLYCFRPKGQYTEITDSGKNLRA